MKVWGTEGQRGHFGDEEGRRGGKHRAMRGEKEGMGEGRMSETKSEGRKGG